MTSLISELWIAPPAVEFIETLTGKEKAVFEWGAGGSTLWFSSRCKSVTSIEHNPAWARVVKKALRDFHVRNARVLIYQMDPIANYQRGDDPFATVDKPDEYKSKDVSSIGSEYRKYASAIDMNDDKYDIIMIDGRARPSCVLHAIPHVASGGALIVDNMDREYYHPATYLIPRSWICRKFEGRETKWQSLIQTWVWINQ